MTQLVLFLGRSKTNIERKKMSFLYEVLSFLFARKKFWLVPIFIMMFIFGGLVVLTKGTAVAPFIYTLF